MGADYPDCKMGVESLGVNMISGNHHHYCKKCDKFWFCMQITHCKKPLDSICLDCDAARRDLEDLIEYVNKELDKE